MKTAFQTKETILLLFIILLNNIAFSETINKGGDYLKSMLLCEPVDVIISDISVCEGTDIIIPVNHNGTALNYQWQKRKIENGRFIIEDIVDNEIYIGTQTQTLKIVNISGMDSVQYRCIIGFDNEQYCQSSVTSNFASLTVKPLSVQLHSESTGCDCLTGNDTINIYATASGYGLLSYQWFKNDEIIENATNTMIEISGFGNYGKYECKVMSECDTSSEYLFINLCDCMPPSIMIQPESQSIGEGEYVHFFCLTPVDFNYQWYKDEEIINGATNSYYEIQNVKREDAGEYYCILSYENCCGVIIEQSDIAQLTIMNYYIEGIITYNNETKTKLIDVIVELSDKEDNLIDTQTSDSLGYYRFSNIYNGEYKIKISSDKTWRGVNPTDALHVIRYYVEIIDFTDNVNKKAADVNFDTHINPTDALLINRRFVKLITSFKGGDWVFEDANILVHGNNITHNIMGLCNGDVDGSK